MVSSSFHFKKPKESPGLLLWQVTILWQRRLKKSLEPYGITHPHFTIMAILLWLEENNQEPTQTKLIAFSKLDKMTISHALKVLSDKGYLKRREDPIDSRAKLVTLTVDGKRLITQLVPLVESIDRQFFCSIELSHQEKFTEILQQIIDTVNDL